MLEGTSGEAVTWPLCEAGLDRPPLVWEHSLCLLLPGTGLSGLVPPRDEWNCCLSENSDQAPQD